MVGVLFGRWSVVRLPFGWWSVVNFWFGRWSVVFMVGAGGGRLVMWSVVGVLHFYWSMVGGSWLVICGLWSVAGRWAVVLYYAVGSVVKMTQMNNINFG